MRWRAAGGVLALVLGAAPGATAQHSRTERAGRATAVSPGTTGREPCAEALHAVEFDDLTAAEEAWTACRLSVVGGGGVPTPEEVRTLEDVAEALHGMRRADGAFCVAPSAPFDLSTAMDGHPADSRGCLEALDRFLRDDEVVLRFLVMDPYSAGRLVSRGGLQSAVVRAARGPRRRAALASPGSAAEREEIALARLAGRQFMRWCRCMPGPQPESVTAVRSMNLPDAVEGALLRGIAERVDEGGGR